MRSTRFKLLKVILFSFSAILFTSGCTHSIDGKKYENIEPAFKLFEFFDGDVKAWGIVQNRSGNVVQRFKVDIKGSIKNGELILDERFEYGMGDGVKKRIWTIKSGETGQFTGSASDILGKAQGDIYANAVRWQYKMNLPVGDKSYKVKFDDWMWAFDERTIMNRSYISKFGLVMAEVTIFMQKQ